VLTHKLPHLPPRCFLPNFFCLSHARFLLSTLCLHRCFVPPAVKQATMTGRNWRTFCPYWPFLVAGVVGLPSDDDGDNAAGGGTSTDRNSHGAAPASTTANDVAVFTDGWGDVEGDVFAVAEEPTGALPGPSLSTSEQYKKVYKNLPVHDAVLTMFCKAAELNNLLFGDNVLDPNVLFDEDIDDLARAATSLAVDYVQNIYGDIHTTKLHRLARHFGDELQNRGNLWEGDTSVKEYLHGACKRMYQRSNKRGPGVALQMKRCEETQSQVLLELCQIDATAPSELHVKGTASDEEDTRARRELMSTGGVSVTGRGRAAAVGDLALLLALAGLTDLLSLRDDDKVSFHKTARIVARLECWYQRQMQSVGATKNFMRKPWFSFVKYITGRGQEESWGHARLILRAVAIQRTCCTVIQRIRTLPPRADCVLSKFKCVRLAWAFDQPSDAWPALDVIDVTKIVRLEDVQPDWYHLGDTLPTPSTRGFPANCHPGCDCGGVGPCVGAGWASLCGAMIRLVVGWSSSVVASSCQ